jgi:hypothetical protein
MWQKCLPRDNLINVEVRLVAKRKIKFKLGKISIENVEIEDELEVATAIFGQLQTQLAGAVQPAFNKALLSAGGNVFDAVPAPAINSQVPSSAPPKRTRKRVASTGAPKNGDGSAPEENIEFVHDPGKYGNPTQQWNTANKAIYALWVVEQATGQKELTATQIAGAFNRHYRDFGTILFPNVTRDLGSQRKKNPPPVGNDPNRSPQAWFLYDAGKAHAQRLAQGWDGKS